jgi:hypothetical protein
MDSEEIKENPKHEVDGHDTGTCIYLYVNMEKGHFRENSRVYWIILNRIIGYNDK